MKSVLLCSLLIALLCAALWCASWAEWWPAMFFGVLYAIASFNSARPR